MERKILLLSAAVLFSTAGLLPAQQRIEHKRPNFAITIPAEFKPAQREGANLLVFTAPREDGALAISLADLGGTIGLEPLKASDLPPPTASSPQIRLEYLPLRDIQVSVLVATHTPRGAATLVMGAQVPLRERGIQINVAGPGGREQELRTLLSSILASFEGELVSSRPHASGVRRLTAQERLFTLSWSLTLVFGWFSLVAYLPLRLALVGRKDALIGFRATWLALSALCIVVGSLIRVIASADPADRAVNTFYALISLLIAFLVLRARGRLTARNREQGRAAMPNTQCPPD